MRDPAVSVVMPVRDCVSTVERAIRSIALQTFTDWELLVIDDASTDGTLDVARRYAVDERIVVLADERHTGLAARLNQGLAAARGPLIARMDGDDVSYPERLAKQVSYLADHPQVDLVGCPMLILGTGARVLGERRCPRHHEAICRHRASMFPIFHPTFLATAEWFRRYGYDERAIRSEDQDLLIRSSRESQFANLETIEYAYSEPSVSLRKTLTGRLNFVRALARDARKHPPSVPAVAATIPVQAMKAVVDVCAVASGTERILLRHRARPSTPTELDRWRKVRAALVDDVHAL